MAAPTQALTELDTQPEVSGERQVHYTAFIRLPFARGHFIDPPLVDWDAAKDEALWQLLFRNPQGSNLDCGEANVGSDSMLSSPSCPPVPDLVDVRAKDFDVTLPFILQQAAWLYERQLAQVRAQMRRLGQNDAALPSFENTQELQIRRGSR
ncbi:MAG: hypothetical protein M1828_001518 [Chrysothrix sp. TS-e1954]|nr:MAG: hypothetical protein M1828_001518 [Chrysothrix sp. TS-e1954]